MNEPPLKQKVVVTKKGRVQSIIQTINQNFWGNRLEKRSHRARQILLERVQSFWIDSILEKSLYQVAAIELGFENRPDMVKQPWDRILHIPDYIPHPISEETKIFEVFEQLGHSLLILGQPGTGKTTTLLELTKDAIIRAKDDPTFPIPVVLNLHSWTTEAGSISNWIISELNLRYYIPEIITKEWLEGNDLLLVLDGLDEVKTKYREQCVIAINKFMINNGVTLLVFACRSDDYMNLANQIPVRGAIELMLLKPQQVDEFLEQAGDTLSGVKSAMKQDYTLREIAKTPLMLSVMAMAYQNKSIKELDIFDSIEQRRQHLFSTYSTSMFNRVARSKNERYSQENTIYWLSQLAKKMEQHNQSILSIEQIQPTWLSPSKLFSSYNILFFVVCLLVFGIFSFPNSTTQWGAIITLLFGVANWYLDVLRITPVEAITWSLRDIEPKIALWATAFSIPLFIMGYLVTEQEFTRWLEIWFPNVFARLTFVFTIVFFQYLIFTGITTYSIRRIKPKPNWKINKSGQNAIKVYLVLTLFSIIWFGLPGNFFVGLLPINIHAGLPGSLQSSMPRWLGGMMFWSSCGLVAAFTLGGGKPFLQHYIIRMILGFSKQFPFRLVRFLDF
ncbi:NACHT domain-containing protein, partial [Chloroflexota bacterium]